MDIELNDLPQLNDPSNTKLYNYLRNVSTDSIFATSVLHILIEERRQHLRNHHNSTIIPQSLKVGDVVTVISK